MGKWSKLTSIFQMGWNRHENLDVPQRLIMGSNPAVPCLAGAVEMTGVTGTLLNQASVDLLDSFDVFWQQVVRFGDVPISACRSVDRNEEICRTWNGQAKVLSIFPSVEAAPTVTQTSAPATESFAQQGCPPGFCQAISKFFFWRSFPQPEWFEDFKFQQIYNLRRKKETKTKPKKKEKTTWADIGTHKLAVSDWLSPGSTRWRSQDGNGEVKAFWFWLYKKNVGLMRELMQRIAGVYDSILIQDKSLHLQNHLYKLQCIYIYTSIYTMYEIKHIIPLTLHPPYLSPMIFASFRFVFATFS